MLFKTVEYSCLFSDLIRKLAQQQFGNTQGDYQKVNCLCVAA